MFGRLVQKELLERLLDARFLAVFGLCAILALLSVHMGVENYTRQMREHAAVGESHRASLATYIEKGNLWNFRGNGYHWARAPEVLSTVVYGLTGEVGREAHIHFKRPAKLVASVYEEDPIYMLFGVLDLAFVVNVVLCLCVLLFTYDAVCGEKEGGTLRLYCSFPVRRATVALAKLIGSTAAMLVPLLFCFLLTAAALALYEQVGLSVDDWLRLGALLVTFILYLVVFAAFGLCVSALTHRRLTSFLVLLALWASWVFILPDVATRVAREVLPVENQMEVQRRTDQALWEADRQRWAAFSAYWEKRPGVNYDELSEAGKLAMQEDWRQIRAEWDDAYLSSARRLREDRANRAERQRRLARVLAAASPAGNLAFTTMDLARTGIVQHKRVEAALAQHLAYLTAYITTERAKYTGRYTEGVDMSGFVPFRYQDTERVAAVLSRNATSVLLLVLLAALGYAGAFLAMLRYDVR